MAIHEKTNSEGKKYYYVYVVAKSKKNRGLKVQKSKNLAATLADAKRLEAKLKNEAKEELLQREFDGDTWAKVVPAWKMALDSNKTFKQKIQDNTKKDYFFSIDNYTKKWNNTPIIKIHPADIEELYIELLNVKSSSTIKRMRASLNSVFKWAISQKKLTTNPTTGIAIKDESEAKRPQILSLDEIHLLLKKGRQSNHAWIDIWTVALLTGMRNGELHALKWSKVDLIKKNICVEESYNTKTRKFGPTKGGYWRNIPINDELLQVLNRLKQGKQKNDFVLPHSSDWDKGYQAKILRLFCKQIGITQVKFHALRACFATHLLNSGISQTQVQKICGWKDSETMDIYIRLAGIDIQNATNDLPIIPYVEVMQPSEQFVP